MSLYTEWRNLSDNHENQEAEVKFWEAYLQAEASIYNELLNNKQEVIEGKVSELAAKYNVSVEYFMGFIDGISESLKEDITLETIGWETILPAAKRKELQKAYKTSKTVVKEEKVGRNDACPCGSGKKYKKCCGK